MKKILFLLLFMPSICLGQSFLRLPYSYILHVYQGDTIKQMFSGDTAKWYTDKAAFSLNKPIFVNGVQLGSGGANIYAKDGVYKSGDTVKLQKSYTFSADSSIVWGIPGASLFGLNTNGESTFLFSSNQNSAIGLNPTDVTIASDNTINLNAPLITSNSAAIWPINDSTGVFKNVNNSIIPRVIQSAGKFDNSSANPTHSNRLNYDGQLFAYGFKNHEATDTVVSIIGDFYDNLLTVKNNSTANGSNAIYANSDIIAIKGESVNGNGGDFSSGYGYGVRGATDHGVGVYAGSTVGLPLKATTTLGPNIAEFYHKTYKKANIDSAGNASFSGRVTQQGIYAGIYVADGAAAQSIPTGATYTKMTCFATNGLSSNCTSDAANDKITITKTGKYYINWSMSASIGTNNVVFTFTAFQGGTELDPPHSRRKISTLGDVGAFGGQGFINVTSVPVDIDLRCRHDNGGSVDITPVYANMTIQYIGE